MLGAVPKSILREPNTQLDGSRSWLLQAKKALIESGPENAVNGLPRWRFERQRDSRRRCLVGGEQLTMDDQPLARQSREVGLEVRDHEKARFA